jgi:hypothetical protein
LSKRFTHLSRVSILIGLRLSRVSKATSSIHPAERLIS